MNSDERRVANISIVVTEKHATSNVNDILSNHGEVIRGRLGIPYPDRGVSIIVVLVDADNRKISSITGALGNIPGVTTRSTMLI